MHAKLSAAIDRRAAICRHDCNCVQNKPAKYGIASAEILLKLLEDHELAFTVGVGPGGQFIFGIGNVDVWQCAVEPEYYESRRLLGICDSDDDDEAPETFGSVWQIIWGQYCEGRAFAGLPQGSSEFIALVKSNM